MYGRADIPMFLCKNSVGTLSPRPKWVLNVVEHLTLTFYIRNEDLSLRFCIYIYIYIYVDLERPYPIRDIYIYIYSFTFHGISRPMHKWVPFHTCLVGIREKTDPEAFYVRGAFVGWVGGLFCFHRGAEHRNCDISVVSRMLSSVICVSLRVGSVQLR